MITRYLLYQRQLSIGLSSEQDERSTDLLFGIDARVDVLISWPLHELPGGDVELADERVVAAPVVIEALHANVPVLKSERTNLVHEHFLRVKFRS